MRKEKSKSERVKKRRELVWRYWPYFLNTSKRSYWMIDENNFDLKIVQFKKGNPLIDSIDKKGNLLEIHQWEVVFEWKVWKYPHKNGKDKEKKKEKKKERKKENWYTLMQ